MGQKLAHRKNQIGKQHWLSRNDFKKKNDAQPNRLQNYVKLQCDLRFGSSLSREIQFGLRIAFLCDILKFFNDFCFIPTTRCTPIKLSFSPYPTKWIISEFSGSKQPCSISSFLWTLRNQINTKVLQCFDKKKKRFPIRINRNELLDDKFEQWCSYCTRYWACAVVCVNSSILYVLFFHMNKNRACDYHCAVCMWAL